MSRTRKDRYQNNAFLVRLHDKTMTEDIASIVNEKKKRKPAYSRNDLILEALEDYLEKKAPHGK